MATDTCPLCQARARPFRAVEGVDYFECRGCDFLFAATSWLQRVDAGEARQEYDAHYWQEELQAAHSRSWGSSLARTAEALLYCRIPVQRFIDIGTGPGFLLDALGTYLPGARERFHGVEKFPPAPERRSSHPNYHVGELGTLGLRFECGVCIEVLEHLTPAMARQLAASLAAVSVPGSLFVFNTGLATYVREEDPGYLDPHRRGHITVWSVEAARRVFEPQGFRVSPLRGKTWAFVLEFQPGADEGFALPMADRIWTPVPENRAMLRDERMGEVMFILGRESARAY